MASLVIEARLVAPAAVGRVLATGAAALVEDLMLDIVDDPGPVTLERLVDVEGGGCRCSDLSTAAEVVGDDAEAVRAALTELIDDHPELTGWSVQVNTTIEPDDEPVGLLEGADDEAADAGAAALPAAEEDPRAVERRLFEAAAGLAGVPLAWLAVDDLDAADPDERGQAVRQARLAAGCLMTAAEVIIDELFDDVHTLTLAEEDGEEADLDATFVLSGLPPRFAHHYTAGFARQFLVAAVQVTRRLTAEWEPLACVAEELALRLLLDQAEIQADLADVELAEGWRAQLEQQLFEDLDHELLYNPAMDGIEDQPETGPPGMAPMGFQWWFVPFNAERPLPPYILNHPPHGGSGRTR